MTSRPAPSEDGRRQLLRHAVATLAYRGGKALRDAPDKVAAFRAGSSARTPTEVLAHVADLLDWALGLAQGQPAWRASAPAPWEAQADRFFAALERLDAHLASGEKLHATPEQLLQGPIADALTHIGQINLLRRLAGAPVRGENYVKARIETGRVGREQAAPRVEFD